MKSHDWPAIRADYVEGIVGADGERTWPSMRQLAALYDMPSSFLRTHAAGDGWHDKRTTFQATLDRERQTKRIKKLSDEAVELDGYAMTVAKAGLRLVQAAIHEKVQQIVEQGKRASEVVDAHESSALSLAAARWYQLGQLSLGEPTSRVEHVGRVEIAEPLDVELEELALEVKRRADEEAARTAALIEGDNGLAESNGHTA